MRNLFLFAFFGVTLSSYAQNQSIVEFKDDGRYNLSAATTQC